MLARQQNHNISEKFVLGFTELTLLKESMLDLRLFNQELLSGSFDGKESFEKPLFHGRPHGPCSPGLIMHCPHTSSHLSEDPGAQVAQSIPTLDSKPRSA
ncbi:hypothetical protein BJV78DRAFT_851573 [Lactifluus subvellereus]|nr:hypothetical protein BJV78DRAFT_851573 [Lactifluus subvellereus]